MCGMWYEVKDVMILLGVAQSKAYQVIRELGKEIITMQVPGEDYCYATPPGGKIQKIYFCKKFMFDQAECDKLIKASTGKGA